ncbi:MAG TPA: hypothetical protein VGJ80_13725 [Gemmatimonadales bacterium]
MTFVFLALLTLIEGVRRVPRGAVVLHRVLWGQWRVEPPEAGERLRLLAWWSPLMSAIVLKPREQYQRTDAGAVRAQLEGRELYTALFDLRVLGVVELIVLVLGLPFALQRFWAIGFLVALAAVLLLCLTIFTALAFSARTLGKPWRAALRWSFPYLSPFAAPRGAEVLLEEAVRDVSPAIASSVLLPADAFLLWVRPFVYDASKGAEVDRRLLEGLNLGELRTALAQSPPPTSQNGKALWCPRCGATFIHGESCSDCGIPLVPFG